MTEEHAEQLMLDYIDGTISHANYQLLKEYLEKQQKTFAELDDMKGMMNDFPKTDVPQISKELDDRINHLIDSNKTPSHWLKQKYLLVAVYTIVILGAGTGFGYLLQSNNNDQLSTEMRELKQLVLQTMKTKEVSAGQRIKAVNLSSQIDQVDESIVAVLLETLETDPNVNVRLSALRSLSNYADNAQVRAGLVESILEQESPIVQVALLNIMIQWQEKSAIKPFQKLLEKPDTESLVVRRIETGLEKI